MRKKTCGVAVAAIALLLAGAEGLVSQEGRPLSPAGSVATQVGGRWSGDDPPRYIGGKWVEVTYGRPILRGRTDIFGEGASYGERLNAGAPVWRAGANKSTRLYTETSLEFGGKVVPPGEYSLFVELREETWTLIVSRHQAQEQYDPNEKVAIWGAYGYRPELDLARAPMTRKTLDVSIDQLTILFTNMTQEGGELTLVWDDQAGSAAFRVVD